MMNPTILDVADLRFAYPGQPPIVAGWSVSIAAGVTLLQGDTGSGTSTLLRVLAGTQPAEGRLTLAGVRLDEDAQGYQRNVFFCDPPNEAFEQVTAREATVSLSGGDTRFSATRWHDLVEGFALAPHLDKPMFMLSTGSKRKVWLAAALASGRALVLLDEPTGGLDAASIACLFGALGSVAQRGDQAVAVASAQQPTRVSLAAVVALPIIAHPPRP